jgi:ABC-2 type transport system permease protein
MEEPIFFSSGFYFPAGGFSQMGGAGRALLTAATFIPATLGLDAMRQIIFPGAWGGKFWILSPELELGILVIMAVVFLVLARYALAYLEMLARREGRLTSRHQ